MQLVGDNITELKENEIFIFGSNTEGKHLGGAAKFAHDRFGAELGVAEGITGQCYAFPTMVLNGKKLTDIDITLNFIKLKKVIQQNPDKQFIMTKVGCGIAGFNIEDINLLFWNVFGSLSMDETKNISLPLDFAMGVIKYIHS